MNETSDQSDMTLDISLDLNEVGLAQPIAVQEGDNFFLQMLS